MLESFESSYSINVYLVFSEIHLTWSCLTKSIGTVDTLLLLDGILMSKSILNSNLDNPTQYHNIGSSYTNMHCLILYYSLSPITDDECSNRLIKLEVKLYVCDIPIRINNDKIENNYMFYTLIPSE